MPFRCLPQQGQVILAHSSGHVASATNVSATSPDAVVGSLLRASAQAQGGLCRALNREGLTYLKYLARPTRAKIGFKTTQPSRPNFKYLIEYYQRRFFFNIFPIFCNIRSGKIRSNKSYCRAKSFFFTYMAIIPLQRRFFIPAKIFFSNILAIFTVEARQYKFEYIAKTKAISGPCHKLHCWDSAPFSDRGNRLSFASLSALVLKR
jgi:hypothetical protein